MIYLVLMAGLAGVFVALYGKRPGSRFRGTLVATVSLLVAMCAPGEW
ncbi:hypothetical protein ACWCQE_27745 [Streptomyces sp. NPDC002409]